MPEVEPHDCPAADIDPFSDEFLSDPFPQLAELRDLGDVVYLRKYGVWAVARHHEVTSVLRDPEVFSNASASGTRT
jgi:4-methoxybenzoate monooxygenase (O-demethylating)